MTTKNKTLLIIKIMLVAMLILNVSIVHAASFFNIGLDKSLMNTYLAEDESGNHEVANVVNTFIYTFITPAMSDFEKEIQIIKYLVATTSYDEDEEYSPTPGVGDSFKAYGALVNHKATCSGYAKAFDLLAKSCGLSSTIVTGTGINSKGIEAPHAWNQIYLDGEWYNVDVTWEDPITNVEVGFNQLFNNYINCTDAEFSTNHIRDNGHDCTATKYGKNLVATYLTTGVVDFNTNLDAIRKLYEAEIAQYTLAGNTTEANNVIEKLMLLGAKYDDNSNYFPYVDDASLNVYVLARIASGDRVITFVTEPNTENLYSIDNDNWLKNNIHIEGKISLHRIFMSDGKSDTRILVFNFS